MCTGIALFPGVNDVVDQLERIFSIRGVPNINQWPEVINLPNYFVYQFLPYQELDWRKVDPELNWLVEKDNGIGAKLLTKFLQVIFFFKLYFFIFYIS